MTECLPSFLNPGTMSTKVATPSLRGCGKWFLKWWPRVSRWWARYMQLLCWMAARWGNLSRFSLSNRETTVTHLHFRNTCTAFVRHMLCDGNSLTCGTLAQHRRTAGKCFSQWRRAAKHCKEEQNSFQIECVKNQPSPCSVKSIYK